MPRLMRMAARTAVVAGTATAVSGRVSRRQQNKYAEQDQQAQQQASAPAPAASAADGTDARLDQLQQLGELKASGVLTDAEFEAQKAKILAG